MSFWLVLDYLQDFPTPDLRPLQEREFQFRVLRVVHDAVPVSQLRAAGACQGLWDNLTILEHSRDFGTI